MSMYKPLLLRIDRQDTGTLYAAVFSFETHTATYNVLPLVSFLHVNHCFTLQIDTILHVAVCHINHSFFPSYIQYLSYKKVSFLYIHKPLLHTEDRHDTVCSRETRYCMQQFFIRITPSFLPRSFLYINHCFTLRIDTILYVAVFREKKA